jgi:hypothetical protein
MILLIGHTGYAAAFYIHIMRFFLSACTALHNTFALQSSCCLFLRYHRMWLCLVQQGDNGVYDEANRTMLIDPIVGKPINCSKASEHHSLLGTMRG